MIETPLYITEARGLEAFCETIKESDWLAVDTEFLRVNTYFPKLCLIQVASEHAVACIDPLADLALQPLMEVLINSRIVKIMHSASQDLEVFYHHFGVIPTPVFDTQMAAGLIEQGNQIGYAGLVKQLLAITLTKNQTRTDWGQRPLTDDQLNYAATDVIYLGDLYHHLKTKLEDNNLYNDFIIECKKLTHSKRYQSRPVDAWQKVKGINKLSQHKFKVACALAAWREREAAQQNRPRRWIISDHLLLTLARRLPTDDVELQQVRSLGPKTYKRYASVLLQVINNAKKLGSAIPVE